jgi:hypothetical protein
VVSEFIDKSVYQIVFIRMFCMNLSAIPEDYQNSYTNSANPKDFQIFNMQDVPLHVRIELTRRSDLYDILGGLSIFICVITTIVLYFYSVKLVICWFVICMTAYVIVQPIAADWVLLHYRQWIVFRMTKNHNG